MTTAQHGTLPEVILRGSHGHGEAAWGCATASWTPTSPTPVLAAATHTDTGREGVNAVNLSIARLYWHVNDQKRICYLGEQARLGEDLQSSGLTAITPANKAPTSYTGLVIKNKDISKTTAKALHAATVVALFGSYDKMVTAAVNACVDVCSLPPSDALSLKRIYKATDKEPISLDWCRFVVLNAIVCYTIGAYFGTSKYFNLDVMGEYVRKGRTAENLFEPRKPIAGPYGQIRRDKLTEIAADLCEVMGEDMKEFCEALTNKDKKLSLEFEKIRRLTWVQGLSELDDAPTHAKYIVTIAERGIEYKSLKGLSKQGAPRYTVTNQEVKQIARYEHEHPDWTRYEVLKELNKWAAKEDIRPGKPGRSIGSLRNIYLYRRKLINTYKTEIAGEDGNGDGETDEDE